MNHRHLAAVFVLATGLASAANAQNETVVLQISVEKLVFGEKAARPFQGVGVFDLIRGKDRLDGARCPDKSGANGKVACTIPCKKSDANAMVVRVKPPSDQDDLAGWVTPAAIDVEVSKCSVKPTVVTMRYEDGRLALNEFLSKHYFAQYPGIGGGGGGGGGTSATSGASTKNWIAQISADPGVPAWVAASASTDRGRAELLDLHRIATEAASAPFLQSTNLTPEDQNLSDALSKWQILSKSALLEAQIVRTVPSSQRSQFRFEPTTDAAQYRASLEAADAALAKTPGSASQRRLVDDVRTLRATSSTGKEAAEAARIIGGWK